ncbi:DUF4928 family protein [Ornithinimicrobium sediminis]|uniref:DUF4928 family protein n=1 Tax=Ornithinimicrobium sediminis TaxID=2904603 RepID=UPI001E4B7383|nr:DUF4928 family protein [Ornithinimicrobium sediminis]
MSAAILEQISVWYEGQRQTRTGTVNTNVMTVGLILAEHMERGIPMEKDDYLAKSQVKGLGGPKVKAILGKHNEFRPFTREGGRTSRKTYDLAKGLAGVISHAAQSAGYNQLDTQAQERVRHQIQAWFVSRVQQDFFARKRIVAEIDPRKPVRVALTSLLEYARGQGGNLAGALCQHLVGAKLALRFPDLQIENHGYTTADVQTARAGDFTIGDTAVHVTTAPTEALLGKCHDNLQNGYRVLILTPDDRMMAARQLAANTGLADRVSVQAIEDYVGNNIEELAGMRSTAVQAGLRELVQTYNQRVKAVESDPAMLIQIPANL